MKTLPDRRSLNGDVEAGRRVKPTLIAPSAVARRLGVTVDEVRNMARAGKVPCERIGRNCFRFRLDEIAHYVKENQQRRMEGP